jgi:hypothetical protein
MERCFCCTPLRTARFGRSAPTATRKPLARTLEKLPRRIARCVMIQTSVPPDSAMRRTLVCHAHETLSAVTAKRVLLDACGSRSCPRSGGDRVRRGPISQSGVESSGIPGAARSLDVPPAAPFSTVPQLWPLRERRCSITLCWDTMRTRAPAGRDSQPAPRIQAAVKA